MAKDDKLRVAIGKKRVERFKLAMTLPHKGKDGAKATKRQHDMGLISPLPLGLDGKPSYMPDNRAYGKDEVVGNGFKYRSHADKIARQIKLDAVDKCRGIGDGYDPDATPTDPVRVKSMSYKPRPDSPFKRQSVAVVTVVVVETRKVYKTS